MRTQVERVGQLIEILDTSTLDQYREAMNSIATLELGASGEFVEYPGQDAGVKHGPELTCMRAYD